MNTMTMEKIEHEVAQDIAEKIGIDWTRLTDFQSCRDLQRKIQQEGMDEDEARAAFQEYFEETADSLEWYAVHSAEADTDTGTGFWDYDEAVKLAEKWIEYNKAHGEDYSGIRITTWVGNLHNPYCTDEYRIGEEA